MLLILAKRKSFKYHIYIAAGIAAFFFAVFLTAGGGSIVFAEETTGPKYEARLTAAYNIHRRLELTVDIPDGKSRNYQVLWLEPYEEDIRNGTLLDEGVFAPGVTCVYDVADVNLKYVLVYETKKELIQASNIAYIENPGIYSASADFVPKREEIGGLVFSETEVTGLLPMRRAGTRVIINSSDYISKTKSKKDEVYRFGGKEYHYKAEQIKRLDLLVSEETEKKKTVTAELGFDGIGTESKETYEQTAAFVSFLSERYNGGSKEYGMISNWNIGVKIDEAAGKQSVDGGTLEEFLKEYARTYRICFNLIKNRMPGAYVCVPVNQFPGRAKPGREVTSKEFLEKLAEILEKEGKIPFEIAYEKQ